MTTKKLEAYGLTQNPHEGVCLALRFDDGEILVTMPLAMAHHMSHKLLESAAKLQAELQEAKTNTLHQQVKDDRR